MGYEVETAQVGAYTVIVEVDTSGTESPREWGNLGTFYTDLRHYNSPDEWDSRGDLWQAVAHETGIEWHEGKGADDAFFRRLESATIWLPVFAYDHSGIMYRAAKGNPFSCPWDSGMAGVIFVTREKVRREYGVRRISPELRRRVESILESEVDIYSAWANGEVYGWIIQDRDGDTVDSCWGYIGEPEYCLSDGIAEAEWSVECDRLDRTARLKKLIRNRVPLSARPAALEAFPC